MAYWHGEMKKVAGQKYAAQMAFLQEEHGFSRTHANALVQYSRGSLSTRRYETVEEYLAGHDPTKQATVHRILAAIREEFPAAEVVIAWNQPMVRVEGRYVFGLGVFSQHILIAPFDAAVIDSVRDRLTDYTVNKKTIQVPVDWDVDTALVRDIIEANLAS